MVPNRRERRAGFSLIEALVALAIASITLLVIFELQIQMARGQARAARAIDQVASQENAIALLADLNFMERPSGTLAIPNGDVVSWTSEPLTALQQGVGHPAGLGAFEVQLFRVSITVERPDGPSPVPLVIERMGWRRLYPGIS